MTTEATTPKRRGRFTRRSAAVLMALMMIAAPAGASIVLQNYSEADIAVAPSCFYKVSGQDPVNSDLASFQSDAATTTIEMGNVSLLEEQVQVTGMTGDRAVYTDVVRYVNNCDVAVSVRLIGTEVSGDWDEVAAELWISNGMTPAAIDPNLDPAAIDDWNDTAIVIAAGTATGSIDAATGNVVIPPGQYVMGAFVVNTGATNTDGTATVNWVASATLIELFT
jgi:hypothetical protein